ncbi:MAG: penicillin-binding transpeptidase domain-containing protein [Actinomycetota bacterium]
MDRQIRRLGIAFVALFAVLFAQVAYVQVVAADRIANQPANFARQLRAEYAVERGQILAADRETVLAKSTPNPDPNSPYRFVRQYPKGELYGQLTGYYSQIYGRSGLEQAMNPYLAGTAPEFTTQNLTDIILGRPRLGGTVLTTLVPRLQQTARDALGSLQGAVVAIDPQNGDILAMYSNPGFDPQPLSSGTAGSMQAAWNKLTSDPNTPLVAHAFQDLYAPGSTFKTVTASAALEHGWGPDKDWPNPHHLELPGTDTHIENFGDEYCNGGAKTVTMGEAFTDSCNVPFAEIGMALQADRMAGQAQAYGFCRTEPTISLACQDATIPFLLPWEVGHFPDASYFANNEAALARSAIGLDNDLTNPLHLALIAAAIANQGTMYAPRLVTEVRDATTGQTIKTFQPDEYSHPLTADSAAQLRDMMVNVVRYGTGTYAQIPNVVVAGKTGTAGNTDGPPNAWFTSFAPAGPGQTARIAVAVIVLDGGDLGNEATGGHVAAPIAKQIMEVYLGG